ncbi:hypothetical protein F5Y16DRAFT_401599 [Xylariaceae sp. FL0255]|nr:hypothetical protein F5Y16DRAFT_401599 [Xylariaceae sp. FL0255]
MDSLHFDTFGAISHEDDSPDETSDQCDESSFCTLPIAIPDDLLCVVCRSKDPKSALCCRCRIKARYWAWLHRANVPARKSSLELALSRSRAVDESTIPRIAHPDQVKETTPTHSAVRNASSNIHHDPGQRDEGRRSQSRTVEVISVEHCHSNLCLPQLNDSSFRGYEEVVVQHKVYYIKDRPHGPQSPTPKPTVNGAVLEDYHAPISLSVHCRVYSVYPPSYFPRRQYLFGNLCEGVPTLSMGSKMMQLTHETVFQPPRPDLLFSAKRWILQLKYRFHDIFAMISGSDTSGENID